MRIQNDERILGRMLPSERIILCGMSYFDRQDDLLLLVRHL